MATINPIEVHKYLKSMSYPITRKGLGTTTKSEKAPSEVVDALGISTRTTTRTSPT